MPFHLVALLEARLPRLRKRPKRLRTRAQILAATAHQLECLGYEGLTVDAITEAAGIARGTFYLHFADRSQAALAVMRIFIALRRRMRPRDVHGLTLQERIFRNNAYYVAVYVRNAKLLLGRESLQRDRQELTALRDRVNADLAARVMHDLSRRQPRKRTNAEVAHLELRVRGVIAMVDELLREIFIFKTSSLAHFAEDESLIAKAISDIWYRSLYAEVTTDSEAEKRPRERAMTSSVQ